MKHFGRRLLACLLTVVMTLSLLPAPALAALVDNTPDQNAAILAELTEFWGDEKTAQEAMELLRKYNLIDEDGNILTDWSGAITIEEDPTPLTVREAMELTEGTVTVNGRTCEASELSAVLHRMEALGLVADGAIVSDWQLEVTDNAETPDELEGLPAVKVLGREADAAALLEVQTFLDGYGLLTEAGCLADWGLTRPGGSRPSNVTELLAMLEDPDADRNMTVTVDGTAITLGDFEIMMQIEDELQRIKDTYLQDSVELTPEQASNLYQLYEQLSENGIQLYSTNGADELVFPSGADHSQRVSVTPTVTVQNGGTGTITLSLDHAAKSPVSLSWRIAEGSAAGTIGGQDSGTVSFAEGEQTKTLTVQAASSDERWNGNRAFAVLFSDISGALFDNEAQADSTTVLVSKSYTYPEIHKDSSGVFSEYLPYLSRPRSDYMTDDTYELTANGSDYVKAEVLRGDGKSLTNIFASQYSDGIRVESQSTGTNELRCDISLNQSYESKLVNELIIFQTAGGKVGKDLTVSLRFRYPQTVLPYVEDGILSRLRMSRSVTVDRAKGAWTNAITIDGSIFDYNYDIQNPASVPLNRNQDYYLFEDKITVVSDTQYSESDCWQLSLKNSTIFDGANPSVVSISPPAAGSGKYFYGQAIPITVEFSEPVYGADLTLTANGQSLIAVDTGDGSFGYRQTFLYTVPENGSTQLRVEEISGMKDLSGKTAVYTPEGGNQQVLPEGSMEIPALLSAVATTPTVNAGNVTYTPAQGGQEEKTTATVTVTLDMPTDTNLRNLIGGSYATGSGFASSVLAGSIDGGETLVPLMLDNGDNPAKLTATVEIDAARLMEKQNYVMEFYTISAPRQMVLPSTP